MAKLQKKVVLLSHAEAVRISNVLEENPRTHPEIIQKDGKPVFEYKMFFITDCMCSYRALFRVFAPVDENTDARVEAVLVDDVGRTVCNISSDEDFFGEWEFLADGENLIVEFKAQAE